MREKKDWPRQTSPYFTTPSEAICSPEDLECRKASSPVVADANHEGERKRSAVAVLSVVSPPGTELLEKSRLKRDEILDASQMRLAVRRIDATTQMVGEMLLHRLAASS